MQANEKTRELLIGHYRQYPKLQIADIFKYLHQSTFGCEHMVSSLENAIAYIRKEYETVTEINVPLIEALDGAYSRVHLSCLQDGLTAETLGKYFFLSSKKEENGILALEEKLAVAKELIHEKLLPFSADKFEHAASEWKALGYPAIHHSDIFRMHYHPAYRVIANQYLPLLQL
ncbi:MAG: hypothetical protein IJ489_10960 [Clostridia bacterium]|nr:hypothetical protein [Clostridia bacterium]